MAMAVDLMGLGLPNQLALEIAEGGAGALTITAAGSSYATSTKLGANQNLASVNSGIANATGVGLPSLTVFPVCLLADRFVINNTAGTTSMVVYASSGVTISAGGTNTSKITVQANTTLMCFPVSTSQWVGVVV